ncbi:MAG: bifunctional phosphopantothenoylcysteine decarboxylase/phosphopantothenate--cysteine ligase CoaBC [Lachnospiraceae bacterium]|nr:bifunctional phosphopantothenoylcysteine decarboxylase/phosphopantothenate--cysteine ligase CoaBC [Lachnospiraceae bacterium]
MLKDKTVVLGITGSIAAYKIANLASMLVKQHADVHVIMTKNATNFIHPITFETLTGNKCLVETFDRNFEFQVEHVSLGERADVMLIAPASANVIAKLAHGIADDMLTTTALAMTAPILVSPAMNTHMYEKKITQENIEKLRDLDMRIIEPANGYLACGTTGIGKMPEPEVLLDAIYGEILRPKTLGGKKIVITAGPTQEAIDPVRYITNHSTGKMGYALARQARYMGADVTLVSGPTALESPAGVTFVPVVSAKEMYQEVTARAAEDCDAVIMSAAVADYRPTRIAEEKIKKSSDAAVIELERTDDILASLGQHLQVSNGNGKKAFLCGFSMETENMLENSKKKLAKKNLDMIVANNLKTAGAGFGVDTNVVTLISRDSDLEKGGKEVRVEELPILSKEEVAYEILRRIAENI